MDTPHKAQNPDQIAAKQALQSARIELNNVLANRDNIPLAEFNEAKRAAAQQLVQALDAYERAFWVELCESGVLLEPLRDEKANAKDIASVYGL